MYYSTFYTSPVGTLMLTSTQNSITGLWLQGQKYFASTLTSETVLKNDVPILQEAVKWLDAYFAGKKPSISALSLAPSGSVFRQEVWRMLCQIPYGTCITYGQLAKKMAVHMQRQTMSAQAIGGAVAHNPISIIIPCHRVVGTNGSLTGYAGGIEKKCWLLQWEGADLSNLALPKKQNP